MFNYKIKWSRYFYGLIYYFALRVEYSCNVNVVIYTLLSLNKHLLLWTLSNQKNDSFECLLKPYGII
jgi:hypothetical protein